MGHKSGEGIASRSGGEAGEVNAVAQSAMPTLATMKLSRRWGSGLVGVGREADPLRG
jgi:hypothetical protein